MRDRVRELVATSADDPLAPFALRPDRSYALSPDGAAAVAYRVRLRTAVASGDPLGARDAWPAAVEAFMAVARRSRWRVAVIAAGERSRPLWAQYGLWSVPIGRDVVLRRGAFAPSGRRFRNLRQAVQRSHNNGVEVDIVREADVSPALQGAICTLMRSTGQDDRRGFSMTRGHLFDGGAPDAVLGVARDSSGRIVAANRYLWAGPKDLSLDIPIRARDAPNGVDERIVAEIVAWGAEHGVDRLSLAFAPFPELFEDRRPFGPAGTLLYWITHVLDPLIKVERLYRYLRKYHAFDQERYVLLRRRQVAVVAFVLLLLEFGHE